jgi:PAS domain-containing protein
MAGSEGPQPPKIENQSQLATGGWYQAIFEQAADGILVIDTADNLIDVNLRGCVLLGYP